MLALVVESSNDASKSTCVARSANFQEAVSNDASINCQGKVSVIGFDKLVI